MKTFIPALYLLLAMVLCAKGDDMPAPKTELATLAGGCFWCTEAVFEQIPGVKKVTSGYIGGRVKNPTYQQVCQGNTGHAEAIQIEYDPEKTSFEKILDVFWDAHDPTQLNRQGNDVGTQYRSAIFYHNEEQKKIAEASKKNVAASGGHRGTIVTTLEAADEFYSAEDYHQEYYRNNKSQPYCQIVIRPKLKKLGLKD
jgi:peptide-methionine (S)-S-oxide reductase